MHETARESGPFRRLSIKGFRRLYDVSLALRPVSVMIGANGSGKSSILDVLTLLAASAREQLAAELSALGGLASNLTSGKADELQLGISTELPSEQWMDYTLSLVPQGITYAIQRESLQRRVPESDDAVPYIRSNRASVQYSNGKLNGFVGPNAMFYQERETALSQGPKTFADSEGFRNQLASSMYYRAFEVSARSPVRVPQQLQPATLPGKNGEDLVSCLFYLRETERDRFEAIEDALRAAFPAFDRLEFPPVAAGTIALGWRERTFSKPLYMHQLSEGTVRFLWLATLLQSPGLTAMTLIDEPEVSLHPELLNLLADLFREASTRTQLMIATHSDRLISFLRPEEVVVMDTTEEGFTTLQRADELDLEKWLGEYTLDELWRNGRLGARA